MPCIPHYTVRYHTKALEPMQSASATIFESQLHTYNDTPYIPYYTVRYHTKALEPIQPDTDNTDI